MQASVPPAARTHVRWGMSLPTSSAPPLPNSCSWRAVTRIVFRGLGVTRAVAGYRPLPAVADELCYIVRGPITGLELSSKACPQPAAGNGALPGEGFADAAFTEARLRTLLTGP